jgi:hypothetical protein
MKNLLAKLLSLFKQSEPTKPVDPWPFPEQTEEAKATPKKRASAKPKTVATKRVAAKKTVIKKKVA